MLSHLDDPVPFTPGDEFRRAVHTRTRQLQRRSRVLRSLGVLAVLVVGVAVYAQVRDASADRTAVITDPATGGPDPTSNVDVPGEASGSEVPIVVVNATGISGSASEVSCALEAAGHSTTQPQNSPYSAEQRQSLDSSVAGLNGPNAQVETLAIELGLPVGQMDPALSEAASTAGAGVVVVLGADWTGVGVPNECVHDPLRPGAASAAADDQCVIPESARAKEDVGRAAAEHCFGGPLPTASRVPTGWELNLYYVDLLEPLADGVIRVEQVYSRSGEGPTETAFISLQTIRRSFADVEPLLHDDGYQREAGYMMKTAGGRLTLAWGSETTTFRLVASGVDRASLIEMAKSVVVDDGS